MDTNTFFNGMFGKVQPGLVRLDMNGNIAVHTSNGYKAYSPKSGRLINCDNFVFNIGEEFFFIIPTNKVVKGDIILASGKNGKRTPKCVIDVNPTYITVINYEDSVVEQILPERHFFMGSAFFYGKIVSMMNFGKTDGKFNMKNMMKFKMMSMFNSKDNDFTDMFNFDEMFDFEEDADKPVEVEVVEVEPKGDN